MHAPQVDALVNADVIVSLLGSHLVYISWAERITDWPAPAPACNKAHDNSYRAAQRTCAAACD